MADNIARAKEEAFIRKHPPLSKSLENLESNPQNKSVDDILQEQEEAKAKYNADVAIVEAALTEFLDIKDPIVFKDKAIAWVRRPTMKEMKSMFPVEMLQDMEDLDKVPPEKAEEYNKVLFDIMAKLIEIPKYTAEEWERKANPYFIKMFYEHIGKIALILQTQIEGF